MFSGYAETKRQDLGQGDGGKESSSVRLERPAVRCQFPEPAGVETDPTGSHATVPVNDEPTGWTDDRRVSVATLREAAEKIVAHQGGGDVKGTAGHIHGRIVRRAARLCRRVKRAASEKETAGSSKVSSGQKRKVDEVEDDSRPQPKRKAPESPPHRPYCDPRLSRVAPIYPDVVAGEGVLVNHIADDPCPWESTNDVELSACHRGFTPGDISLNCRDYRQYQDFQTRRVLSLVASKLSMWLDNQQPERV
ncbi:uncharacterized protein [Branchiostoma lanceolatum]|uniref:uncharacterized protein isoform X1 n=1 Tax=Branchiostoma lanceolatum TaxID=7740 RepID=UPI003454DA07